MIETILDLGDPMLIAVALVTALASKAAEFSTTELRTLSFINDRRMPAGSVSFAGVRLRAREELVKRGRWRLADQLRAWFSPGDELHP